MARNDSGATSVIGAQIREEIDIMSIIQFRAISIVVSFNVDARFVGVKIPQKTDRTDRIFQDSA
jgi:hypothetical protein